MTDVSQPTFPTKSGSQMGIVPGSVPMVYDSTTNAAWANSVDYPFSYQMVVNGAPVSNANPLPTGIVVDTATLNVTGGTITTSLADGGDATQGAKADSAATGTTGTWSVVSLLKGLYSLLSGVLSSNLFLGGAAASASNPVYVADAYASTTVNGSFTSASAANAASGATTSGMDTVILTVNLTGAISAGVLTFQVYDGLNWVSIKASNIANYTTAGSVNLASLTAGTPVAFQVPVAGFPQFQVCLTTPITGTGTIATRIGSSSAPDTSLVTVGLDPAQPLPAGTNALGWIAVSALPSLPTGTNAIGTVGITYPTVTPTNKSITIATGGTAQALVAANASRKGLRISAPQAAGLWWSDTTATPTANGSGCYWLPAGQYYEFAANEVTNAAVSVLCAVTGAVVSATEYN